jgi:hypothetical protein
VAGATVEIFLGCGHGPAVRVAWTAADGAFTLPCVPPGEGTLWILTPAGAADYVNLGPSLDFGERPADFVLAPAATARGRVVDAEGDPIAGAIVRSWQEQRGPATLTDGDGRFVLEGCEPGHGLQVFHPSPVGEETTFVDDGWVEGVPVIVRMTAAGPVEPPADDATLVVRARRADGTPASEVEFSCVRLEDGSARGGEKTSGGGEDDPPAGEARLEVAAGTWRVLPDSPFDAETFDPVEVAVPEGGAGEAVVLVGPQARLRIRGEFAAGGVEIELAVRGGTLSPGRGEGGPAWAPRLPREGPATLWVQPAGGPRFPFPVGPAGADGAREAVVAFPAPHRLRLPAWADDATLLHGVREVAARRADGTLRTWATGRLVLRVEDREGRTREVPLDLPSDRAVDVDPAADLAAAPVRAAAEVRFLGPDGSPVEAAVNIFDRRSLSTWRGGQSLDAASAEADWPCFVVARRAGWVPRTLFIDRPGPVEVRWGDASIDLELRDADGKPADALVLAGGVVIPAPEGRVALGGFEAGVHELIACFRDEPGGGRRIRVALKAGEKRVLAVALGEEE